MGKYFYNDEKIRIISLNAIQNLQEIAGSFTGKMVAEMRKFLNGAVLDLDMENLTESDFQKFKFLVDDKSEEVFTKYNL
ncbi:hypothetical protein [Photobacterium sp. J15]|uniref:hypothetical protein n=1 Tax=Photobacterium sp. J15 TaxID=265901 RepID=UPI0007E40E52|nr:hypothetical protein [Photobacterium sp. J15]